MRTAWLGAVISTALLTASAAHARAAGVFDKWLNEDSPQCVPVSAFKPVSAVTDLTHDQFQFVRALYVALPPISRDLPPGDHAIMALAGGDVMLALVDGDEACARFLAPDFIQGMLIKIGEGKVAHIGTPVSYRPSQD